MILSMNFKALLKCIENKVQHSTETALLKVLKDIYLYLALVLLDLTAMFDIINHTILISCLEHFSLQGNVLNWFISYLTNQFFSVNIANFISSTVHLACGVSQGSI